MLCSLCGTLTVSRLVNIFEEESKPSGGRWDHRKHFEHHTYHGLRSAAENGCSFCGFIIAELEKALAPVPEQDWTPNSYFQNAFRRTEGDNIRVRISITQVPSFGADLLIHGVSAIFREETETKSDSIGTVGLSFRAPRGARRTIGKYTIGYLQPNPDLASNENFEIARDWLHDCRTTHAQCPRSKPVQLPTRLIQIAKSGDTCTARLIMSNGKSGEYVALSHCWGGPIDPVLTTSTLDDFKEKIDLKALPSNFRDSVIIAHKLDFEYLWIDSLCIIQDSQQDWEAECLVMGEVYLNASLTISASVSPRSTTGMINSIDTAQNQTTLRLDDQNDDTVNVFPMDYLTESFNDVVFRAALSTRGWTLQEKLLSSRVLHYGQEKIHWQCSSLAVSSDGTAPMDMENVYQDLSSFCKILHSRRLSLQTQPEIRVDLYRTYYELANNYSRRQLTNPSDKFPAFSGLASEFHQLLGGQYIAGLWTNNLRQGLGWMSGRADGQARHVQTYRAPSWSWAVTDDEIVFRCVQGAEVDFLPTKLGPNYVSSNIRLQGANKYGEIESAELLVKCYTRGISNGTAACIISAVDTATEQSQHAMEPHDCGWIDFDASATVQDDMMPRRMESQELRVFEVGPEKQLVFLPAASGPRPSFPMHIDLGRIKGEDYRLMFLGTERAERGNYLFALVLEKDQALDAYARVGLTMLSWLDVDPEDTISRDWKEETLTLI